MKKTVLVLLVVLFSNGLFASEDWGKTGHRAVGEIADDYLSRKAEKEILKLLDGHSLAFVANYGDDIKSDRNFDMYRPWHYVSFPFGEKYETYPKSEKGDIIQGIKKCVTVLKDKNSSKEDKVFYLKMLVHFMGDLHQPLHIGLAEDKGGNDFQVRWFKDGTNLHTVWDSKMIDFYDMSYSELAKNTDVLSKQQIEAVKKGTVIDWMYESREICENIYQNTEVGEKLGYNYMYKYMDVLRFQLQKGGIRLATVLNEIFN
ncbi:S1/P1 nuclease [Aequorivita marisscotiae]|uniref:S1/P1 nuclease n=1 Tax=Aequorivita marisscotiae TaxID=3040348 RepID=A0ABY8KPF3_9FLAO|nr:S1/P1 nuclease [Aequorivita sp. Ant34-E75]WGF91339.1 S1/P1 nuclease [Aequorivita sp. Ant34-E75]